jgi:hypothetical protein
MQIDYVSDSGGDWAAVYVDGAVYAQDHSIDEHKWLELLETVSFNHVEVRKWEVDFVLNDLRYAPTSFLDLVEIAGNQLEEM